ncbi:hypothetical protein VTK73DRAFT_2328 [Phialemonium thermophilum]|uniref:Uncharacterized protein n=1 Tax=Phialemonium thermophilum TaxID=223376 RepID=A0ABR3VSC0_9PEZI
MTAVRWGAESRGKGRLLDDDDDDDDDEAGAVWSRSFQSRVPASGAVVSVVAVGSGYVSAATSTVYRGSSAKKAASSCSLMAWRMAARQAVAVMMMRGRAFCRIQAISVLVRAGETRVAVRPEARTPARRGPKGRQLGSWISTTGAISGRAQDGVGGRTRRSSGSRPRAASPRATARESCRSFA